MQALENIYKAATQIAHGQVLQTNPLDTFALSVVLVGRGEGGSPAAWMTLLAGQIRPKFLRPGRMITSQAQDNYAVALGIINKFYLDRVTAQTRDPLPCYWARFLALKSADNEAGKGSAGSRIGSFGAEGEFPYQPRDCHRAAPDIVQEQSRMMAEPLSTWEMCCSGWDATQKAREDMEARRRDPARAPVVAYRALGMAAKEPRRYLGGRRAALVGEGQPGPSTKIAIVARDLAECPLRPRGQNRRRKRVNTRQSRHGINSRPHLEAGKAWALPILLRFLARARKR